MKYLIIPILLFSLTSLNLLTNKIDNKLITLKPIPKSESFTTSENTEVEKSGVLVNKRKNSTSYFCSLDFNPSSNSIFVENRIIWRNTSDYPTDKVYFNFTRKITRKNSNDDRSFNSDFNITKFSSSEPSEELVFVEKKSNYGKSLAAINFKRKIVPGDSVEFLAEYRIPIVSNSDSIDIRDFSRAFIDDEWYPRIPRFAGGKWEIYSGSKFNKGYRDFADFNITISYPSSFEFITSGTIIEKENKSGIEKLKIKENNILDFVIIAWKNSKLNKKTLKFDDRNDLNLNIYFSSGGEDYINRIIEASRNSFIYLNSNIGSYPYKDLTIVNLPYVPNNSFDTFSKVIIINSKMFLAEDLYDLEESVAQKIAGQYFACITSVNTKSEAWLSLGLSKYLGEKIREIFYSDSRAAFNFLKYIRVNGLLFLSAKGIPLIYTLGDYPIAQEALSLEKYYSEYLSGSISDSSYLYTNKNAFDINSIDKPFLTLLSMERLIGREKTIHLLKDYFERVKFNFSTVDDLFSIVAKKTDVKNYNYMKAIYGGDDYYDLKINSIRAENGNNYKLSLQSSGKCNFVTDIVVYTENDTLQFNWDTSEKWKELKFSTGSKVVAAEIDPNNNYIFDKNYSNNSYSVERMNWAPISISLRWFFWVQNALMILGSAA